MVLAGQAVPEAVGVAGTQVLVPEALVDRVTGRATVLVRDHEVRDRAVTVLVGPAAHRHAAVLVDRVARVAEMVPEADPHQAVAPDLAVETVLPVVRAAVRRRLVEAWATGPGREDAMVHHAAVLVVRAVVAREVRAVMVLEAHRPHPDRDRAAVILVVAVMSSLHRVRVRPGTIAVRRVVRRRTGSAMPSGTSSTSGHRLRAWMTPVPAVTLRPPAVAAVRASEATRPAEVGARR